MAVRKTKHDIDKEVMFNKIMPSLGATDTDDDAPAVKPRTRKTSADKKTKTKTDASKADVGDETEEEPKAKRGRKPSSKTKKAPESEAEETDNTVEKTDEKKQTQKKSPEEAAPAKAPVKKNADNSEYEVINLNEELINLHFDDIFQKFNHCHCNACHFTVMALALNELETNYVAVKTNEKKKVLKNADDSEVKSAVIQAILKLIINPIHD